MRILNYNIYFKKYKNKNNNNNFPQFLTEKKKVMMQKKPKPNKPKLISCFSLSFWEQVQNKVSIQLREATKCFYDFLILWF